MFQYFLVKENYKKIRRYDIIPKYTNIVDKMKKINNSLRKYFDIKNTIFKDMQTKENSLTYKEAISTLKTHFFGPFGVVTEKNKLLQDYYRKKKANIGIDIPIFTGTLDYFNLTTKNDSKSKKEQDTQKKFLSMSKELVIASSNFDVFSIKSIYSRRLVQKDKNYVKINKKNIFFSPNRSKKILKDIKIMDNKTSDNLSGSLSPIKKNMIYKNLTYNKEIRKECNLKKKFNNIKKLNNFYNSYNNFKPKKINDIIYEKTFYKSNDTQLSTPAIILKKKIKREESGKKIKDNIKIVNLKKKEANTLMKKEFAPIEYMNKKLKSKISYFLKKYKSKKKSDKDNSFLNLLKKEGKLFYMNRNNRALSYNDLSLPNKITNLKLKL